MRFKEQHGILLSDLLKNVDAQRKRSRLKELETGSFMASAGRGRNSFQGKNSSF